MSSHIAPSELLDELSKNASSRKKRSLQIIYDACEEQHKRGSKDFSPVTIGHLSEELGGPKERTIRNKDGEDYRAIMNAWANYTDGVTRKPRTEKKPSINDGILNSISDPTTRALVGVIMAENKKLKGENSLLKRNTILTLDMRSSAPPVVNTSVDVKKEPRFDNLKPIEIEALQHAISNDFLKEQGWSSDEQGRIKSNKGRTIFKPGFVTALRKILENNEK